MPRTIQTALLLLLSLALVGCGGDSHEKVAEDMLQNMEDITEVLKTIKDEVSAKEASSELESLTSELQAIAERADALDEVDETVDKELEDEFGARFKTVRENYLNEMFRILMLGEAVTTIIEEAMDQFDGVNTAPLGG